MTLKCLDRVYLVTSSRYSLVCQRVLLDNIAAWMRYNQLQLNKNKTELLTLVRLCSSSELITKYAAMCWIDYGQLILISTKPGVLH
jgi:hypothetical protein